ncbi:hypothetical protein [Rosistilla oblonga]|uniref:hypothetical protein n=1 Tax=Rosistilla oblonga TaxID=2527990 RepID=UPI003A97DB84
MDRPHPAGFDGKHVCGSDHRNPTVGEIVSVVKKWSPVFPCNWRAIAVQEVSPVDGFFAARAGRGAVSITKAVHGFDFG